MDDVHSLKLRISSRVHRTRPRSILGHRGGSPYKETNSVSMPYPPKTQSAPEAEKPNVEPEKEHKPQISPAQVKKGTKPPSMFDPFPDPVNFSKYERYEVAALEWKRKVLSKMDMFYLPVPTTLNYHVPSPPHIRTEAEKDKRSKDYLIFSRKFDVFSTPLSPENHLQMQEILNEGRPLLAEECFKETGPRGQNIPIANYVQEGNKWPLIPRIPDPHAFTTYSGYVLAMIDWYKTASKIPGLPIHPMAMGSLLNLHSEQDQTPERTMKYSERPPLPEIWGDAKTFTNQDAIEANLRQLFTEKPAQPVYPKNPFDEVDGVPLPPDGIRAKHAIYCTQQFYGANTQIDQQIINKLLETNHQSEQYRYRIYTSLLRFMSDPKADSNCLFLNSLTKQCEVVRLFHEFSPVFIPFIEHKILPIRENSDVLTLVNHTIDVALSSFYNDSLRMYFEYTNSQHALGFLNGRQKANGALGPQLFQMVAPQLFPLLVDIIDNEKAPFIVWYINTIIQSKVPGFEMFVDAFKPHLLKYMNKLIELNMFSLFSSQIIANRDIFDVMFPMFRSLAQDLSASEFGSLNPQILRLYISIMSLKIELFSDCFKTYPAYIIQKMVPLLVPKSELILYQVALQLCKLLKRSSVQNQVFELLVPQVISQVARTIQLNPEIEKLTYLYLMFATIAKIPTSKKFFSNRRQSFEFLFNHLNEENIPLQNAAWKALVNSFLYQKDIEKLLKSDKTAISNFQSSIEKLKINGQYNLLVFMTSVVMKSKVSDPLTFLTLFGKESHTLGKLIPGFDLKGENSIRTIIFHKNEFLHDHQFYIISRLQAVIPLVGTETRRKKKKDITKAIRISIGGGHSAVSKK